jgi:hypothetical protein
VGIIEVVPGAGTTLREIFDFAKKKGQELGCEIVVDRAIHRLSVSDFPRWSFSLPESDPLAPPNRGPTRAAAPPYFGYTYSAPAPATTVYVSSGPSTPPIHYEYICGMYRRTAPQPPAVAPVAPAQSAAPAQPAAPSSTASPP